MMGIRILIRFIRMMRIVTMGIVRMVAILVMILIWLGCMVLNLNSSFLQSFTLYQINPPSIDDSHNIGLYCTAVEINTLLVGVF